MPEAITRGRLREFGYLDWDAAREKEACVIERFGVFEPTEEQEDVVAEHPNATVLPVLEANAVKNREKPKAAQVSRVRIVVHGGKEKGQHLIEGINSRMDGIQAAILNVKMAHIKKVFHF